MNSIQHPAEKNQSHISPGKNDRQNATVAEVIATALACGYRWEYVGGDRPLLTNEARPTSQAPPALAPGRRTLGVWIPIHYGHCTCCDRLMCVHGQQLGHVQKGHNIFCGRDCAERWHAIQVRLRRQAARQAQEVQP